MNMRNQNFSFHYLIFACRCVEHLTPFFIFQVIKNRDVLLASWFKHLIALNIYSWFEPWFFPVEDGIFFVKRVKPTWRPESNPCLWEKLKKQTNRKAVRATAQALDIVTTIWNVNWYTNNQTGHGKQEQLQNIVRAVKENPETTVTDKLQMEGVTVSQSTDKKWLQKAENMAITQDTYHSSADRMGRPDWSSEIKAETSQKSSGIKITHWSNTVALLSSLGLRMVGRHSTETFSLASYRGMYPIWLGGTAKQWPKTLPE